MIDLNADILLTDGSTLKAENLKTDLEIADLSMKPQMVRRRKVTKEKEYQILEFENGAKFFCLVYLSFLTREADITAENLRKGDKVLGFDGKNYTEIEVTSSLRISPVTRKSEEIPKKVKMLFFETFEDMPFVANGICIGLRKQMGLSKMKRSLF